MARRKKQTYWGTRTSREKINLQEKIVAALIEGSRVRQRRGEPVTRSSGAAKPRSFSLASFYSLITSGRFGVFLLSEIWVKCVKNPSEMIRELESPNSLDVTSLPLLYLHTENSLILSRK